MHSAFWSNVGILLEGVAILLFFSSKRDETFLTQPAFQISFFSNDYLVGLEIFQQHIINIIQIY